MVQERQESDAGRMLYRRLQHMMMLSGFHCDMIERQNLARFPGSNAHLPCGVCAVESTQIGNHRYVMAYSKPRLHSVMLRPAQEVFANDERLWVPDRCVLYTHVAR